MRILGLLASFGLCVVLTACGSSAKCPASIPADGSSCDHRGLACESGGGDHQRCSTRFTCSDALNPNSPTATAWKVTPPDPSCQAQNTSDCPADYNVVPTAQPCPTNGTVCDYDQGRCDCVSCTPSCDPSSPNYDTCIATPAYSWRCRSWNDAKIGSGCPSERPALGTQCTMDGLVCRYDDMCEVTFGPDLTCTSGLWQPRIGSPLICSTPICGITD